MTAPCRAAVTTLKLQLNYLTADVEISLGHLDQYNFKLRKLKNLCLGYPVISWQSSAASTRFNLALSCRVMHMDQPALSVFLALALQMFEHLR